MVMPDIHSEWRREQQSGWGSETDEGGGISIVTVLVGCYSHLAPEARTAKGYEQTELC